MSEHEGFCVPLLEAFYMNVPVLAWDACAIPYTAGKGAMLVGKEKNYAAIGEMIHQICSRPELQQQIVKSQKEQLNFMMVSF